jgi:hypothetical protein
MSHNCLDAPTDAREKGKQCEYQSQGHIFGFLARQYSYRRGVGEKFRTEKDNDIIPLNRGAEIIREPMIRAAR